MSYFVYQLINNKTGAVYVGMTGRTLDERKAEHMGLARGRTHINAMVKNISKRPIAEAVRAHPNPADWDISALWQTPVYPEAREMEKAFIRQMNAIYVCLNADVPKLGDGLPNAVAHSVITGQAVLSFPWEWRGHEDYPGVIVYKGYSDKTWKYGYRGRGDSDHTGLWKEFVTDDTTFDDAHFTAAKYFEDWKSEDYSAELFEQEYLCDFTKDIPPVEDPVCNIGMTEQQNYLMIFQEELGELAMEMLSLQQTISKAMRFGLNEQREGYKKNHERIQDEWNDLLGSVEKLREHGVDLKPDLDKVTAKMAKIDKFTTYSKEVGTIL